MQPVHIVWVGRSLVIETVLGKYDAIRTYRVGWKPYSLTVLFKVSDASRTGVWVGRFMSLRSILPNGLMQPVQVCGSKDDIRRKFRFPLQEEKELLKTMKGIDSINGFTKIPLR